MEELLLASHAVDWCRSLGYGDGIEKHGKHTVWGYSTYKHTVQSYGISQQRQCAMAWHCKDSVQQHSTANTECVTVRKIFHGHTKLITLGDKSQTIIALTPTHTTQYCNLINTQTHNAPTRFHKQTNKHRKRDNNTVTHTHTFVSNDLNDETHSPCCWEKSYSTQWV